MARPEKEALPYFIPGTTVTVEAGINGFICHTEDGALIARSPEEMLGVVLATTTNHAQLVAERKEAEEALGQTEELEGEIVPEACD